MNRKTQDDLLNLYEDVHKKPMTVGTVKPGDLEGKTKEKGPKKAGAENTDAKKPENAPANLQGDTVAGSTKKGKPSKFDEMYQNIVKENIDPISIEDKSFDDEAGDFPPTSDEAEAEGMGEEDMEQEEGDAFSQLADLFSKASELFSKMAGSHAAEPEMISDETVPAEDEITAKEAVETTSAPDGTTKLTAKGAMTVGGVKVTKGSATVKSGASADGKPSVAKDTTLGPKTCMKAPGTGPIATGKDAKFIG